MAAEPTPSIPYNIQRVTLTTAVYPILAPVSGGPWSSLAVANVSAGTLAWSSYLDAGAIPTDYMEVVEETQRQIVAWQPQQGQFRKNAVSGYLQSDSGGVVEIIWS